VLVLGLESSCDETGAAVVDAQGIVRSDVVHSQVAVHAPYGGVVPELASRDHLRNVGPVVREALRQAGSSLADIGGVAVTNRPGLVGALLVGVQAAKGIAWAARKPLVGVDHLVGHVLAVFLQRGEQPEPTPDFPFVCLLASGGHTAIYRVDAPRADAIVELGATRDDAAGEAFDKVAKLLGLGYPGGPIVDRLAATGDASRVALSAPMARSGSFEMSFSGIKTQVAQRVARDGVPTREATSRICARPFRPR
jgi:N6-L-threonylcarbamoyladenine synthase